MFTQILIKIKFQSYLSLCYFLIAASVGILLRLFPITYIDATYKYMLHTHSHIALLGWVYIAFTTLIFHLYLKNKVHKKYTILFKLTQITILGMLLSFPTTGYALYSILFSTLFLICTYWFYAFFRKHHNCVKNTIAYKFINTSLLFLVLSSIGPWALGVIMNTLGNTSHWYKNAIYFYLHFQANGWFIFCLLGFFMRFLEKHKIYVNNKTFILFYWLMVLSCCFTLFLSFLWIKPSPLIYVLAFLGAVIQIVALLKFQQILNLVKADVSKKTTPFIYRLLQFIYILFILKIVLQLLTSIPFFAELVSQIIDFVIGYLHLTFLGITSLSLFVFLKEFGLLKLSNFWLRMYLTGFILSEILIFYKGFCIWQQHSIIDNYFEILVGVSALIPISLLGICIQNIKAVFPIRQELS